MATKPKDKTKDQDPHEPRIHKTLTNEVYQYAMDQKSDDPSTMSLETYRIQVTVDKANGKISIQNEKGKDDFVFNDYMNNETRQRWLAVARLIEQAVKDHVTNEILPF